MAFKKFSSLVFRELRLSRKMTLSQLGLLLVLIIMSWGMIMSEEGVATIIDVLFIMTALIATMPLMLDDNFKADVNTGWLVYSYTLPVTPFERAAARFVRLNGMCLIRLGLSLANAAAMCAYLGKPFGANLIVWNIVIFASMITLSLPSELILLRARNAAEHRKAQSTAGLATVGLMVVLIAAMWKLSGIGLNDLAGIGKLFELPTFTASSLAWALPLLLAVMAASFAISQNSLKTAFSGSKPETAAAETQTFTAKASVVKGMMYKELRQNRLMLILAAAAPFLLTAFPFCFSAFGVISGDMSVDEMFATATDPIIRMLMCAAGIFAVSALMSNVFTGDDKKLWAYFVVSVPRGVGGYLRCKYAVTLLVIIIYTAAGLAADRTLEAVKYLVTGYMPSSSGMMPFYGWGAVALLLLSAIDIPFIVRFGVKRGSIIKMTSLLLLCGAAVAVFVLIPDSARESVVNFLISIANGGQKDLLTATRIIFPPVSAAAFVLSCRISRGVFMRGAEGYDK